jgi:hypothetical protein
MNFFGIIGGNESKPLFRNFAPSTPITSATYHQQKVTGPTGPTTTTKSATPAPVVAPTQQTQQTQQTSQTQQTQQTQQRRSEPTTITTSLSASASEHRAKPYKSLFSEEDFLGLQDPKQTSYRGSKYSNGTYGSGTHDIRGGGGGSGSGTHDVVDTSALALRSKQSPEKRVDNIDEFLLKHLSKQKNQSHIKKLLKILEIINKEELIKSASFDFLIPSPYEISLLHQQLKIKNKLGVSNLLSRFIRGKGKLFRGVKNGRFYAHKCQNGSLIVYRIIDDTTHAQQSQSNDITGIICDTEQTPYITGEDLNELYYDLKTNKSILFGVDTSIYETCLIKVKNGSVLSEEITIANHLDEMLLSRINEAGKNAHGGSGELSNNTKLGSLDSVSKYISSKHKFLDYEERNTIFSYILSNTVKNTNLLKGFSQQLLMLLDDTFGILSNKKTTNKIVELLLFSCHPLVSITLLLQPFSIVNKQMGTDYMFSFDFVSFNDFNAQTQNIKQRIVQSQKANNKSSIVNVVTNLLGKIEGSGQSAAIPNIQKTLEKIQNLNQNKNISDKKKAFEIFGTIKHKIDFVTTDERATNQLFWFVTNIFYLETFIKQKNITNFKKNIQLLALRPYGESRDSYLESFYRILDVFEFDTLNVDNNLFALVQFFNWFIINLDSDNASDLSNSIFFIDDDKLFSSIQRKKKKKQENALDDADDSDDASERKTGTDEELNSIHSFAENDTY